MAYTIRLLGLECLMSQEIDGDEIYLKLNGAQVWEAQPDKMSHLLDQNVSVSAFDFATGQKLTGKGWVLMPAYKPDQFILSGLNGDSVLQIWDADMLTSDDLLGQTPIDASQASGGKISVVFQRIGAHYRLTYQVELET